MLTKKNFFLHEKGISLLLFSFVILEVIAELFSFKVILFAFRPFVTILIMYLYWITSKERSLLFFSYFILEQMILFNIKMKDES